MNIFDVASLRIRTPDRWYNPTHVGNAEATTYRFCAWTACAGEEDAMTLEEERVLYESIFGLQGVDSPVRLISVFRWNDDPDRTFDEVHTALAEASRRVREQEEAFATYAV